MKESPTLDEQLRLRDQERQRKIEAGEIDVCDIDNPDCENCGS